MFHNAKNLRAEINGGTTEYLSFGEGSRDLIIIPGVGDGFKTAKGMAIPFSVLYRDFAKDFKVWFVSRRNDLPEGFSTRDMAEDLAALMEKEGIGKASILGVSQGGMIAQWLAIDYPEKVDRLVLAVTASRPNPLMKDAIGDWFGMAERDDYAGIMLDTAKRSYTGSFLKKNLRQYRLLSGLTKPKDYTRFRVEAESCLTHDAFDELPKIGAKTLVIGGGKDLIVGREASVELADRIEGSELFIYEDLAHGLYEQAKDFNERVLTFLKA